MRKQTWNQKHECAHGCASLDETYANIERAIDEIGWAVMGVMGDDHHRPWAYTIGLVESFAHPELIATGLDVEAAQGLLNIFGRHVELGHRYEADPGGLEEIHGVRTRLVAVHEAHWRGDLFNQWVGYYEGLGGEPEGRSALQVVWADAKGHFPNDPGNEKLQLRQPLLARPPVSAN